MTAKCKQLAAYVRADSRVLSAAEKKLKLCWGRHTRAQKVGWITDSRSDGECSPFDGGCNALVRTEQRSYDGRGAGCEKKNANDPVRRIGWMQCFFRRC